MAFRCPTPGCAADMLAAAHANDPRPYSLLGKTVIAVCPKCNASVRLYEVDLSSWDIDSSRPRCRHWPGFLGILLRGFGIGCKSPATRLVPHERFAHPMDRSIAFRPYCDRHFEHHRYTRWIISALFTLVVAVGTIVALALLSDPK